MTGLPCRRSARARSGRAHRWSCGGVRTSLAALRRDARDAESVAAAKRAEVPVAGVAEASNVAADEVGLDPDRAVEVRHLCPNVAPVESRRERLAALSATRVARATHVAPSAELNDAAQACAPQCSGPTAHGNKMRSPQTVQRLRSAASSSGLPASATNARRPRSVTSHASRWLLLTPSRW